MPLVGDIVVVASAGLGNAACAVVNGLRGSVLIPVICGVTAAACLVSVIVMIRRRRYARRMIGDDRG